MVVKIGRGALVNHIRIALAGAWAFAGMVFVGSPQASALDGWLEGKPVFRSDILREQQRIERDREARRREYYQANYPPYMEGGGQPDIAPVAPPVVTLNRSEAPGTIIIDSGGKRLFYVLPGNQAYQYPISVGREGFSWTGEEKISRIAAWPNWNPPPEMRQREPWLPIQMTGGVNNPLGAKALYLGNTLYRIHGTNDPKSIGRASSSGCFRMMNHHVIHLATLANVGTPVRVVARY
jgi:lipoprotein-anchoring transpeptidase ErfK/SrfK